MDAQHEDQSEDANKAELNDFGKLAFQFLNYGRNASNNLQNVFVDMTAQQWIRLIVVVGAYLLLRPYAIKYLGKRAVDDMIDEDNAKAEAEAKISANQLRGEKGPVQLGDTDDEGEGTATDWGLQARVRQRKMLKKLLEEEEKRKQAQYDSDSDSDIADLLED